MADCRAGGGRGRARARARARRPRPGSMAPFAVASLAFWTLLLSTDFLSSARSVFGVGSAAAFAFHGASGAVGCASSASVGWGGLSTQLNAMKGRAVVANVTMFVEDVRRWAKDRGLSLPLSSVNATSRSSSVEQRRKPASVNLTPSSFRVQPGSFNFTGRLPELVEPLRQARVSLGMALVDLGLNPNDRLGVVLTRFRRLQELLEQREAESRATLLPGVDVSDDEVLPVTDISLGGRKIWIITTAALPWMTGTSVNPLLRAAYLAVSDPTNEVTLMLPWLEEADQGHVYPHGRRFSSPAEQQEYVEEWLKEAGLEDAARRLKLMWYPSRYLDKMVSIFPMGDITRLIPDSEADICILEEPEHINWYRATGTNWSKKFSHVVGIVHTNYVYYAAQDRSNFGAQMKGPWVRGFNKVMARAYCDKLIKLSAALQKFAEEKEVVCNVHGVRERFLQVGDDVHAASGGGFTAGAYMLGKMLWEKGYDRLWALMAETAGGLDGCFPVDVYGSGPEQGEISARAEELGLPVVFHGAKDHALLKQFKVFVNPSVSEVLCTTIAEALAMGKWVVCARHPSNEFFYQFPNCLPFDTPAEFAQQMDKALTSDPSPLSPELRYSLSWAAATERLMDAAKVH
jgi:digalactosyldiacylglycerol synthase